MAGQPFLEVDGVTLQYKTKEHLVTAAYRVSFRAMQAERLILLGPSGCGKSSLLKAVGGFLKPVEGQIVLSGRQVRKPGPDRAVVFQEFDQLLLWKTVLQNVSFALREGRKLSKREAEEQAMHYIQKVNLTKFANAYPYTLSGGMKQRVAIARCLALNAELILMDEPFGALDALTRQKMQEELLELWQESRFTMIFVTHSIEEAILLGTRIVLLSPHPGQVRAELNVDVNALQQAGDGAYRHLYERIQRILFQDALEYTI